MLDLRCSASSTFLPAGLIGDPGNLFAILWRGRRLIAIGVIGCVTLALAFLVLSTRLYQASAKLLVLQQGGRPLSVVNTDQTRLVEGTDDYIPTHAMIVRSPIVVARALEDIGLNNLPSLDQRIPFERTVQAVIKNLAVTRPDRNAKILQVDYRARSPEEAVRVVQGVAASYKHFLEDVYQKNNSDVVVLMTKARDDLNKELKDIEESYLEFRRQTPLLTSDGAGRPLINHRIQEWNRATNDTMVRAIQLKAQLELGQKLSKDGIGLWSISYAMDQLGTSQTGAIGPRTAAFLPAAPSDYLRQLNMEQQQLAERFGPQSTRVKEIQEQIASVQQQSRSTRNQFEQAEVHDLLGSIEQSLKSLVTMRGEMSKQFEGDLDVARKTEIAVLKESNLRNNLERHRTLFNTVVDQLKQAKLTGDFSGMWCQTIEPAYALEKPVRPLVSLTLAAALALGSLLGLSAALVSEIVDPRIRTVEEVRRVLPIPLLGQVPQLSDAAASRFEDVCLISQALPRSSSAEAYKVTRANLDLARRNQGAKIVLVTSAQAGEGKTAVASNLAICLAQAGRKVLLLDADLRHPALHSVHGLLRDRGLTHVLRDLLSLHRVVQTTAIANLEAITSGPEASNPTELLSSPLLHRFLNQLREKYDTVIVDSPALLAVADPAILAAAVDGIVLVVRASATRRDDASRAFEMLKELGTPLLGTLVNGVAPESNAPRAIEPEVEPHPPQAPGREIRAEPQMSFSAESADTFLRHGRGTNGRPRQPDREENNS